MGSQIAQITQMEGGRVSQMMQLFNRLTSFNIVGGM